jgi:ribosomal protein L7/L12
MSTSAIARAAGVASASFRSGFAAVSSTVRQRSSSAESLYKITAALGELKGVPMKIGQLLSYVDSSLPEDAQAALSALQTHSRPMPLARALDVIRRQLGPAGDPLVASLAPQPIASASIGQVYRGRLPDGTDAAVKVRYPGIAKAIESDFGPAALASRMAALVYPALRIDRFVREARARIIDECDYRAEARFQTELAARFTDHPVLSIPAVHAAYSGERVLTTTWVTGLQLDDFLATDPGQDVRDRFGEALIDFYVGSVVRWGVLSGDPHPGNYLFCADGRLAIIDHGCTRTLDAAGDRLARVTLALEADSPARVNDAIAELGGEALLMLRIRYGLASVLQRLRVAASWRELIARHGIAPAAASRGESRAVDPATRPGDSAQDHHHLPAALRPAPVAPPPPPPPPEFDVVLLEPGTRTIEVVREVRDAAGLGIHEAKQLIDRAPQVVKHTSDRDEAELLKGRLESSGATVEIRIGQAADPRS